jgi:hypothetical protein
MHVVDAVFRDRGTGKNVTKRLSTPTLNGLRGFRYTAALSNHFSNSASANAEVIRRPDANTTVGPLVVAIVETIIAHGVITRLLRFPRAPACLQSLKILLKLVTSHEQLGDRSTDLFFFTKNR